MGTMVGFHLKTMEVCNLDKQLILFFNFFIIFFGVPHLATCIFYNEPELGLGIDPGMALTPLPSSIGQGSNPRPSDCELSALPLDHSFRLFIL